MALYNGSLNSSGFAKFVQVWMLHGRMFNLMKISIRNCALSFDFVQIHNKNSPKYQCQNVSKII